MSGIVTPPLNLFSSSNLPIPDVGRISSELSEGESMSSIAETLATNLAADPPTPAPSPRPDQAHFPIWNAADQDEDNLLKLARNHFADLRTDQRQRFLTELLNMCTTQELVSVAAFVSPRLKKDFLKALPVELSLRVLMFIDDPQTLARSSQVSKCWHELVSDDLTWKRLCRLHRYRRLSAVPTPQLQRTKSSILAGPESPYFSAPPGVDAKPSTATNSSSYDPQTLQRPRPTTYKSHFKQRYQIDSAWKTGGTTLARHITEDQGTITWSCLTNEYIVVGLDNSKIHVFANDGRFIRTLVGHESGVWTLDLVGQTLVSGGCDRNIRVWDVRSGNCLHVMRGHTSTVRCIEFARNNSLGQNLVVSGSRDATIRVWDATTGVCKHVLIGHSRSVRCIKVCGNYVASGSYDLTCKLWSIEDGTCVRTFSGHVQEIYTIGFDGATICTGSLDSTIRVWNAKTGDCLGVLTGHTSLVGQLQMRYPTLVTGGPDGSIRVWDLQLMKCVHHLAGHDNSVTTLQFDDQRIVSASSDGMTKLWDIETGKFIRHLTEPSTQVWRVAFGDDVAVIMSMRNERSCLEVISFWPQDKALAARTGTISEEGAFAGDA